MIAGLCGAVVLLTQKNNMASDGRPAMRGSIEGVLSLAVQKSVSERPKVSGFFTDRRLNMSTKPLVIS